MFKTLSEFPGLGPQYPVTVQYYNHQEDKYVTLGQVYLSNEEDIFQAMQGENWSPNGEARELIEARGADHTSMSVGDRIVYPSGRTLEVTAFGFKVVEKYS
jgi:hypothetical protein